MKVAAILETLITSGGAFHQGINAILQMKRICGDQFDFSVFTTHRSNLAYLQDVGITAEYIRVSVIDKALIFLAFNVFARIIIRKFKIITAFEKQLIDAGVDIAYFLTQSPTSVLLNQTQFITTVFDICHREFPEFPEVREFGEFYFRELHFNNNLASAALVITDSQKLTNYIKKIYCLNPDRIISSPYGTGDLSGDFDNKLSENVIEKYGLTEGYFFYPAQFWAHKNHIRILEALNILNTKSCKYRVVFAGGDKGNLNYIKEFISAHQLTDQVKIIGFVPQEHMKALYLSCIAVVMPTYFGPTNIPPIEAWILKKPLIYSTYLKAHAGDAAIFVDPDNALEIADAMVSCTDKKIVDDLIIHGNRRIQELNKERESSEEAIKDFLAHFTIRRRCWK